MWKRIRSLLGIVDLERISPQEAQIRSKAGALIVDVRSPLERKALQIPGSRAFPLDQLVENWSNLPKEREIICQCASGVRSSQAARFLVQKGLKVSNLSGGISAWQAAGLPVKKG
jgi:rhodanese-related sulfurtransferase